MLEALMPSVEVRVNASADVDWQSLSQLEPKIRNGI